MWSANVSVQNPAKCPRCVSTSDHHQHCRGDAPGVTVQCSVGTLSQCSRHILLRKGNMSYLYYLLSYLYYLLIVRGGAAPCPLSRWHPGDPPAPHCTVLVTRCQQPDKWHDVSCPFQLQLVCVWLQRPSWLINLCTFGRAKASHGKIEKIK